VLASPGVLRLAAAFSLLATAAGARAADPEGGLDLRVEAGGGVDSNPRRLAGFSGGEGFATALARVRLSRGGEGSRLALSLTEAGRLYPGARGADALASRLEAAGSASLPAGFALSATASASDLSERAGSLDRHALRGEAALVRQGAALGAALAAGWSLFAPREASLRPFRSQGPEGWLRAWWSPAEGHRLTAAAGLSAAEFPAWEALAAEPLTRGDTAFTAAAGWSWGGAALASAEWDFTRSRSNAAGGDFDRHRVALRAAARCAEATSLALRASLQWTRYPDPLLLPSQQRLAEGQEALDLVEARLARSLGGPWEVALSLAWTRARGGPGAPAFSRLVGGLSLGWRTQGP